MKNNQAPRVLIFSMAYLPMVGGAELAVKEITDRISNDFDFDLITARLDKKLTKFEKIGKINVYRVGNGWILDKYLYPWLAYFKAKELQGQRNYQVTQAIMAFYAGLAALFFKWKFPRVKYLLTMQSGDSNLFIWLRTWFWYPVYRQIYIQADLIQVISRFLAKRARKYGYKGKIEIVPNGVDLKRFTNKDSIKPKEKIVISVSRLVKKNGLDDLIKAIQYLSANLLIIGTGPDEQKLKSLAKNLKIENKVSFIGYISHQDLPRYLSEATVFVRPSLSEGLGNSFLEAMAMGVPIIGTPVGGIVDFLEDRKTGLFCQVKDSRSIAEKIKEVLDDKELREELIKNGQKIVKERYNWDTIAKQMKKIYKQLL